MLGCGLTLPSRSHTLNWLFGLLRRALALVVEWATLHEEELLENWRRLHADEPPLRIAPLE